MDDKDKHKSSRTSSLFKTEARRVTPSLPPTTRISPLSVSLPWTDSERFHPFFKGSGGKRNYVRQYINAAALLDEELKRHRGEWGSFKFPDLQVQDAGFYDPKIRAKIHGALDAHRSSIKDRGEYAKVTHVIDCMLIGLTPIAKRVPTHGSNELVFFFLLCLFTSCRSQIELHMG
jgi:hypothetical protein